MANTHHQLFAQGKKVYYVNGKRFYNSKQKNDGNSKAEEYCLDNFLDIKTSIIQFDSDTECDYYEYLESEGKSTFFGEYMFEYSWAEETTALLEMQMFNKRDDF